MYIRARQPMKLSPLNQAFFRKVRQPGDLLIRLLCRLFGHEECAYLNKPGIPQFCVYCYEAL